MTPPLGEDTLGDTRPQLSHTHHSSFRWAAGGWGSGHGGGWGSARAARRAPAAHWQQLRSVGWGPLTATPAPAHRHFRQPLLRPAHFQQWRKGAGTPRWRNPLWLSWWQPARQNSKNHQSHMSLSHMSSSSWCLPCCWETCWVCVIIISWNPMKPAQLSSLKTCINFQQHHHRNYWWNYILL